MDPVVSVQNKNFSGNTKELAKFLESDRNPKVIYTDNSMEFGKAGEDLSWNHCTSTPNRSETNGIAERAVRRVKEGTSAVLLQSSLNESWWADSMECYTCLRNVTDLLSDGKTPYERRFGQPFKGPIIPFGSLVEYLPITAKDQSRIHQFGKKVLPGLFLGYALYAGEIWKGDVLVADLEELETMDASEIYSKRLNAKEVIFPKQGEFIFPIADGRIKPLGGGQELRTSTLVRHRPIQGESTIDFLGESEGSLPQPQDSLPDAGEAINDFWSMSGSFIYRHHVEPRVKLYSPREESFPVPLKYIDFSRTTHTNLDVKQEKRIDDYWNIDGSQDLSDPWTGIFHTLLRRRSWRRIRLCRFCMLIDTLTEAAIVFFRTLPVDFPSPTIPKSPLSTLFCHLILDHGVPFIISISGLKIIDSYILFGTCFHHCLQSVIIRSYFLLMNLQVIQFQYGLDFLRLS